MQLLLSALPGFRDIRAPLTAGYIWLFVLYLRMQPPLDAPPTNEIAASAWELAQRAGPVWTAVGIAFLAYLLGGLTQFAWELVERFRPRKVRSISFEQRLYPILAELPSPCRDKATELYDSIQELRELGTKPMLYSPNASDPSARIRQVAIEERQQFNTLIITTLADFNRELGTPATVLVADMPLLFSEVDRLRAEADLRLTVSIPLFALVVTVAQDQDIRILLATVFVVLWAAQGYFRLQQARLLLEAAVDVGKLRSVAVERFLDSADAQLSRVRGLLEEQPRPAQRS